MKACLLDASGAAKWVLPGERRTEQLSWFQELRLRAEPSAPLVNSAMQIAVAEGRTVYDSLHIALAVSRGLSFVADERLVSALGTRFPVRWLGSLPSSSDWAPPEHRIRL